MTAPARPHRDVRWLQTSAPELVARHPLAEAMDTDVSTVDALIADGSLPSVKLGRRILIPKQSILDLLRLPRLENT
jgi:excisionase family DNA binding protein